MKTITPPGCEPYPDITDSIDISRYLLLALALLFLKCGPSVMLYRQISQRHNARELETSQPTVEELGDILHTKMELLELIAKNQKHWIESDAEEINSALDDFFTKNECGLLQQIISSTLMPRGVVLNAAIWMNIGGKWGQVADISLPIACEALENEETYEEKLNELLKNNSITALREWDLEGFRKGLEEIK